MWCPTCGTDLIVTVRNTVRDTGRGIIVAKGGGDVSRMDERIARYECPNQHYTVCRHEYLCPACGEWCVDPLFHHPPNQPVRLPHDGGDRKTSR